MGWLFDAILGQLISVVFLVNRLFGENRAYFAQNSCQGMIKQGKRHIDFLIYDMPTTAVNVAAAHTPNILFTFFTTQSVGFFFLTQRVQQNLLK